MKLIEVNPLMPKDELMGDIKIHIETGYESTHYVLSKIDQLLLTSINFDQSYSTRNVDSVETLNLHGVAQKRS